MNEVFRFLFLRPPAPGQPVDVAPSTRFARELAKAHQAANPRLALKQVAEALVGSERRIGTLSDLVLGAALTATARALAGSTDPTAEQVSEAVTGGFGHGPGPVTQSPELATDRDRLADNLIAAKLLSRDGPVPARELEALLRLLAVIERVAAGDQTLAQPGAVAAALRRPTVLGQVTLPGREVPEPVRPAEPEPSDPEAESLRERLAVLDDLRQSLSQASPRSFSVPTEPLPPRPAPEEEAEPAADAQLRQLLLARIRAGEVEQLRPKTFQRAARVLQLLEPSSPAPAEPVQPLPYAARLTFTREAVQALPESQRQALGSLGLDLSTVPVPAALTAIGREGTRLQARLAELEFQRTVVTRIGSHLYEVEKFGPDYGPQQPAVPTSHGKLEPVGVGDLLVVREQLKRYQGGEVGHIENILQGELKKREHLRRRETEDIVTVEVETKRDEERDSQTTDRFELQRESSEVVKQDSSFKAGLSVSGSYGPTVEFKASTDFTLNNSKEESAKTATTYAKEVTDRASSKVSERHREERIMRTLEVFEERNEHGVDNTGADGHVIGVYQWVDKVYEAQVFNYGQRMMFDIMVPEPAAFWIHANAEKPVPGAVLVRPPELTLTPDQVDDTNYAQLLQQYQVTGVKPPPAPYTTVSKTFEGVAPKDPPRGETKIADLPVPDGYQALKAHVAATGNWWNVSKQFAWQIVVSIGRGIWTRSKLSPFRGSLDLHGEQGSLPIGVANVHVSTWIVTVEVECQRTERAYQAWQIETHAAIQQAYLKLERDYQEQLAALEVRAGIEVQGRHPAENRMIERAELKKQSISVLTAQHYDLFGAITSSSQGYPQPLLPEAEAEGRYIRFFEQAFEWEHMTYLFYPYFWGRKAGWTVRALLQDVDPEFAEFLKAGAARIVVPVRPGFEPALAHFMDTGEIWEGADPPTLTSPLYVSIIDEIKERTGAPGDELPQGDPWDFTLPTTLVRLRPDGSLPSWTKQPDGSWQED